MPVKCDFKEDNAKGNKRREGDYSNRRIATFETSLSIDIEGIIRLNFQFFWQKVLVLRRYVIMHLSKPSINGTVYNN